MATTRAYRQYQEQYVYERWTSPCSSVNTMYYTLGSYTDVVTINRESRVRPTNLLDSLTSREPQYRVVCKNGKQAKVTTVNKVCGNSLYPVPMLQESLFAPGGDMPVLATVDWGQAVRLKIKSRTVNFAETIGEWREAKEHLTNGANVLKRAAAAAKQIWRSRGSRRGWVRRLKAAGLKLKGPDRKKEFLDIVGADLAINFGILPTMTLIDDTLTMLNQIQQQVFRVQVTIRKENRRVTKGLVSGLATWEVLESKRAIIYVRLKKNSPDFVAGNILESIWAGTRLSFMVDWFLNVGGYLSALDAMASVDSVKGVVITRRRTYGIDERVQNTGWRVVRPATYLAKTQWRDVVTTVPMPSTLFIADSFQYTQLLRAIEVLATLRNSG